jgi:hypothetical protein
MSKPDDDLDRDGIVTERDVIAVYGWRTYRSALAQRRHHTDHLGRQFWPPEEWEVVAWELERAEKGGDPR